MFYRKIKVAIILILMAGEFVMMYPEQPETSWENYNLSFWEIYHLKRTAKDGNYEDAYRLGMYYYLIKKNDNESTYWFKIAAAGNHVESIRELIIYYNIINTEESRSWIKMYIQKLKEIALMNKKKEDFYFVDLELNKD